MSSCIVYVVVLSVESAEEASCLSSQPILVTSSTGYLSNAITEATAKGSTACPWFIKGQPGQTIQLTLIDFGVWRGDWGQRSVGRRRQSSKTGLCHMYGEIEEPGTGSRVTVCGGDRRETIVYQSDTHEVRVHLVDPARAADPVYFVLHYQGTHALYMQVEVYTSSICQSQHW